MFTLNFSTTNEAFTDTPGISVANILRDVATAVQGGLTQGNVKDVNGNTVGYWALDVLPVLEGEAVDESDSSGDIKTYPEVKLHLYKAEWDEERLTLTGCLPNEFPSHYTVEDRLVKAGVLRQNQCDSESGQLFVYPDDVAQADKIATAILEMKGTGGPED